MKRSLPLLQFISITYLILSTYQLFAQEKLVGVTSGTSYTSYLNGTVFSIGTGGGSFVVHHKFYDAGFSPKGDLVRGTDGNFYGMTEKGGKNNAGVIFKMSSSGLITKLYDFEVREGNPLGSLIDGNDGFLYGMSRGFDGVQNGRGIIFKISKTGALTIMHKFAAPDDPRGSLFKGNDGLYYGMTRQGGNYGFGTIFKITSSGVFTRLRSINPTTDGGGFPNGSLVQGVDGAFYGLTGPTTGYDRPAPGSLIRILSTGYFTVMRRFNASTDGGSHKGSLIKGTDGSLYGMASAGGLNGYGTIFKVTPIFPIALFKVIGNFSLTTTGGTSLGSLAEGTDGNLYGMTSRGGAKGYGTIFKISKSGPTISVLRHLTVSTDGGRPNGTLSKNLDGSFFGMTSQGGKVNVNSGTIFKITSSGVFTLLVNLPDNALGYTPVGTPIQASDGFIYGTCSSGGDYGGGIIYKMCTSNTFSVLYSFDPLVHGSNSKACLVQLSNGDFYGTTSSGGAKGFGTIFKFNLTSGITVIKHLDSTTGGHPQGGLYYNSTDGNFYGMCRDGGAYKNGTIFKITPAGAMTILRSLKLDIDGGYPYGELIKGSDGLFYGTTSQGGKYGIELYDSEGKDGGTVFKISTVGTFTVLKSFNIRVEEANPKSGFVVGPDGYFYGTTSTSNLPNVYGSIGSIFKISITGLFIPIKKFDLSDGTARGPLGKMIKDKNGVLFGTTAFGGGFGFGSIYRLTSSGSFTVIKSFNPQVDGDMPMSALSIQKPNPVAIPLTVTTLKNTSKVITLNGTGGTPLKYAVVYQPKNGTLTGTGASRTYTPFTNYIGKDSLTYYVTWGCQISTQAKVRISVNPTATIISGNSLLGAENGNLSDGLSAIIAPNPATDQARLIIKGIPGLPVNIQIIDIVGRNYPSVQFINKGFNYYDFSVSRLSSGNYIVIVKQGGNSRFVRLIVKK